MKIELSLTEEITIIGSLQMQLAQLKSRKNKTDFVKKEIEKTENTLRRLRSESKRQAEELIGADLDGNN
jgi:HAMP domain-containing protein